MSVFCITSRNSVGCTFFDWTIHFLSGQQDFYQADQQQWIPLSQDPVLELNAHGHLKNHPEGINNIVSRLEHFLSLPQDRLYSAFPAHIRATDVAKKLGISKENIGDNHNWQQIQKYTDHDYNQLFEVCHNLDIKLIYVADNPNSSLYFMHPRQLDRGIVDDNPMASTQAVDQEQQQLFFKKSIGKWNSLGLTDIWDQRERLALDTRPLSNMSQPKSVMHYPHLWLDCQELWTRGEVTALRMLDFLKLKVCNNRLTAWKPIYARWQEMQLKRLEFNLVYQHVVDSIVNNWYYEIDLTFEQEVVILHCLIYQHNLNIKNWELAKFPSNTQELHKLLEPNIHKVIPY